MGIIIGKKDYQRWQSSSKLTPRAAIRANCYVCNGGERAYCGGERSCALYRFSQFTRETLSKDAEKA